jgi:hypothetical protein
LPVCPIAIDRAAERIVMSKSGCSFRQLLWSAAFAVSLLASSQGNSQTGPFASLAGAWTGAGHILIKDGGREPIRCRATYSVTASGSGLSQVMRCAGDSYRFDLSSDVTAAGERLSGNWNESGRKINGTLSGRVSGETIDGLVEANGFSATITMKTNGKKQTIAIRSQNTELRGVDVTLTRP